MKTTNIEQAAQDILNYGFIKETRIVAASTEELINKEKYLRFKYSLTREQYDEAFSIAEELERQENMFQSNLFNKFPGIN